jgi:hypothetical protein
MDEDYDEIDLLIDTDPIELGRRLRATQRMLGEALGAVKDLQHEVDQLREQLVECDELVQELEADEGSRR